MNPRNLFCRLSAALLVVAGVGCGSPQPDPTGGTAKSRGEVSPEPLHSRPGRSVFTQSGEPRGVVDAPEGGPGSSFGGPPGSSQNSVRFPPSSDWRPVIVNRWDAQEARRRARADTELESNPYEPVQPYILGAKLVDGRLVVWGVGTGDTIEPGSQIRSELMESFQMVGPKARVYLAYFPQQTGPAFSPPFATFSDGVTIGKALACDISNHGRTLKTTLTPEQSGSPKATLALLTVQPAKWAEKAAIDDKSLGGGIRLVNTLQEGKYVTAEFQCPAMPNAPYAQRITLLGADGLAPVNPEEAIYEQSRALLKFKAADWNRVRWMAQTIVSPHVVTVKDYLDGPLESRSP